jgi:membrane protein
MLLASAAAFRLFLWLLPLALVIAGILAGLAGGSTASVESTAKAAGITGAVSQEIVNALHDGHKSWWIAVVIGLVGLVHETQTLTRNLALVNAHAWQVANPKPTWRNFLVTTLVFVGACIVLLTVGASIPRLDRILPGGLLIAIVTELVASAAAWLAVSMRLPDGRTGWHDLLPGCVLFGLSIAFLHAVSRVYIPRKMEQSSELYGAFGVAGVILVWLLAVGQVIVGSALANAVWVEYQQPRRRPHDAT